MSIRPDEKDAERKIVKPTSQNVNSAGESFPEVREIKESVKDLAYHIKDASADKMNSAAEYINDSAGDIKASGRDAISEIETKIKAKPAQSVIIAFAAGLLVSLIFGRR